MNTITIPKTISKKGDLVVISRKEYEELLMLKKAKEFIPTSSQKKALVKAEKNLRQDQTLTYNELIKGLGFKN